MQSVLQLGINEYADLTSEEFRASKLGLKAGHDGSFRCNMLYDCKHSAAQVHNPESDVCTPLKLNLAASSHHVSAIVKIQKATCH